jgi:hypothetical protein
MNAHWETREQLLNVARAAGYRVSVSQLGRLYRAGLIPAPQVRALGRGRGTESRYPPGSVARLLRVMAVHADEHRLTYVAWRLWWEDGGPAPPAARALLVQLAKSWDSERIRLAELLEGDQAGDPEAVAGVDRFYADAESGRVAGVLGQARRNIGRERFAAVLRVLADVGTGRFTGYDADETGDVAALVDRALEFDRARTDHLADQSPWLDGSTEADFVQLSRILDSKSITTVLQISDAELDRARLELRSLIELITAVAPLLERVFGRAAFGFGMLGRAVQARTPRMQAFMLIGWLALRSDDTLHAGLQRLVAVAPEAEAMIGLYGVIGQLREEIPALAPVLSDQRLAAAQLDSDAAEALNSEIAQMRRSDPGSFDAFFEAHPEVGPLLGLMEEPG